MGMFDNIRFPYFNLQQLNLDWILTEVKRIAGFMPQDGNVGDILTRKSDGAAWEQPAAVQVDIDGLPADTQIMDNDELIFYDVSAQANRKIKPPDLMDSMASNAYPSMDGTASAGTSKKPARYDHVHPTDTSRAKASYFSSDHLKVANGGTGAGNASDARTNLGLGDVATENIVPVSKGGTGASDAATARTNLGIPNPNNSTQLYQIAAGIDITSGQALSLNDDWHNYKMLFLLMYNGSISGGNRMGLLIPCYGSSFHYPIAQGAIDGDIRIEFTADQTFTIVSTSGFSTLLLTNVIGIK